MRPIAEFGLKDRIRPETVAPTPKTLRNTARPNGGLTIPSFSRAKGVAVASKRTCI